MQRELMWFKVGVCIILMKNLISHVLYSVYKMSIILRAIYLLFFFFFFVVVVVVVV